MTDDGNVSSVRVLVVDDFEPFRSLVRSLLKKTPRFLVVREVSDGLEAVRKVTELDPDLVLLDINLPGLSGIEVARRIRTLSPRTKIVFLTQDFSDDLVAEAFNLGAHGYVVKARTSTDLLPAVETVMQGCQFVIHGLTGSNESSGGARRMPRV
jgi:DNA-binding NarL/FixJ family response regulator